MPLTGDHALLDAAPDAMLLVDGAGSIVFASTRCTELLGWLPAELVGRGVDTLVPPRVEGHAALRRGFMDAPSPRAMGAGRHLHAVRKDGTEVPVDIALSPVDVDGVPHVLVAMRDMRAQREVQEKLHLQSLALEAAASGVVITDQDGFITSANAAACRMTGYALEELAGRRTSILRSGWHDDAFYADLWKTVSAGTPWRGTIVNRRKDGSHYHEEQTIAPVRDAQGRVTHFIAVKQDITERIAHENALREVRDELAARVAEVEALHAKLREEAIRDPLTHLFNRRYLQETLPREMAVATRNGGKLALAVVDVDHFKRINDTHGHDTGDRILASLGGILLQRSRTGDVACRYGGEEFVVVLLGADGPGAVGRVEEWRAAFRDVVVTSPAGPAFTTCSVGVAAWNGTETPEALFKRADAALYDAKRAGRDRVIVAR